MEIKEEVKELEKYYKDTLKDFAKHYVAMWNSFKSLGLTDPQTRGAISNLFELSSGTMVDITKEAKQSKKGF